MARLTPRNRPNARAADGSRGQARGRCATHAQIATGASAGGRSGNAQWLVHPEGRAGVRKIERFREWIHAELAAERDRTPPEIWGPFDRPFSIDPIDLGL